MTTTLLTAGAIAKEIGASDTKVKQAIKELNIAPVEKKGCRVYYSAADVKKIKTKLS